MQYWLSHPHLRWIRCAFLLALAGLEAHAIPYYARSRGLSCTDCHLLPPKLGLAGEEFLARGYRRSADGGGPAGEVPISVWITGRHEDRRTGGIEKSYVPKVELISGGPIAAGGSSYFLEWRVVSLDVRTDGTLRDRGGRFEDAFVNWDLGGGHGLRAGQFRALNQYDVSLRLSVSEPTVFSTGLPGKTASDSRITGLRAFAPAARSPGLAYSFQSSRGALSSDGWFHFVNVPFVGELALPLGDEAQREASFELEGPAKGVFLETFHRRGANSLGAHAFLGDGRRLIMGVGRIQRGGLHATGALGLDDASGRSARTRYSAELEYLATGSIRYRTGAGFRFEQIARAGRQPAYIPYLALAGPNATYTVLLQVELRFQGSSRTLFVDLSTLF